MAAISGNLSYVKLGSLPYAFGKWRLAINSGIKEYYAFGTQARLTTEGAYKGTATVEGAYDAGNMPLGVGGLYELHLGFRPGVELVLNARVADVEYSTETNNAGDPAQCSVTFESHGEFAVNYT